MSPLVFTLLFLLFFGHVSGSFADETTKAVRQPGEITIAKPETGKHFALLISVNEYNQLDGLSALKYCDNDMDGLQRELEEFDYTEIVRMHAQAPDSTCHVNRTNVKEQLKSILDRATGENDTLLIAFSGHGVQEGDSRYLCPPNTPKNYDPGDLIPLYASGTNASDQAFGILNIIEKRYQEGTFSGTCYLFVDACRNGNRPDGVATFPRHGRIHLFSSCAAGQVSYEEDRFENGRFMHFVIQAFNVESGADLDFETLTSQVDRQMRKFNANQIPALHSTQYERTGRLLLGQKKPKDTSRFATRFMDEPKPLPRREIAVDSRKHTVRKPAFAPIHLDWPDFSAKDSEEQRAIVDLTQLPGLNGEWWFQEMPWYLPIARLALSSVLSAESASAEDPRRLGKAFLGNNIDSYLDTNTNKIRELIWNYLVRDECRLLIDTELFDIMKEMRKQSSQSGHSRELQYKKLKSFLDRIEKSRRGPRHEVDLYTLAVIEHQMALLSDGVTRKADTNRAAESYRSALDALKTASENHDSATLFYQLCLADYTRFLATLGGTPRHYSDTFKQLSDSLRFGYKNSLFQIALFVENAVNESNFGHLREAGQSFREAELRIKESKIHGTGHPLVAHYNEQYGWYRIDYWRLKPARENFETALLIRQYNAWSSSNPIDMMYVTYGQHAMGTVHRFAGNDEKAREYFEEAKENLKRIRAAMRSDSLSLSKNRLDEREASTLERLADLALYGENFSETEKTKAAEYYARGAAITNKLTTTRPRLLAKQALLFLKSTHVSGATEKARQCLREAAPSVISSLENLSAGMVVPVLFFQAASIAVDLTEAAEKSDMERFSDARQRMREFLERFMLFSRNLDGQKRDTMELRLYCASLLLEADRNVDRPDFAAEDSLYLSVCLYNLSEKEGIHAFLRPHYERQLRLRRSHANTEPKQEDIRALAMGIQRMRSASVVLEAEPQATFPPLDSIKGAPDSVSENQVEEEQSPVENAGETEPVYNPTKNPLIDTVTLAVFYFPEPIDSDEEKCEGVLLLVPSGNRAKEWIPLGLTRQELLLKSQTGELADVLQNAWNLIEEEAGRLSPIFWGVRGSMRQSVVVSWSDESCWPKDSPRAVTVEMFPFKNMPNNVSVQ